MNTPAAPDLLPTPEPGYERDNEAQQAQDALRSLLAACSIVRVVTVDDSNIEATEQQVDRELILAALRDGTLTIDMLCESDTTRDLATEDGEPREIADLIDDVAVDPPLLSVDEMQELTNAARLHYKEQHRQPAQEQEDAEPFTRADHNEDVRSAITVDLESLTALEELFKGIPYQALTLAEWDAQKSTILGDSSNVLVLFDRDFRLEGGTATTGDHLIGDVLQSGPSHVFCGMITHAATSPDAERQISSEIVGGLHLDPVQVIVINRDLVRHAPLDLARKIKAAVLARELISLRDLTTKAVSAATADGIDELGRLDAYTLLALVEAAAQEGTHDAHNILRVAASQSRRSLEQLMHHDDVMLGPLAQLRKVRTTAPYEILLQRPDDIAQRHHTDSFDDDQFLAASNLPLEPGDIFRGVDPAQLIAGRIKDGKTRCILLTQPCDTVMRSFGARTGNPKMLSVAPLEWIEERRIDKVRKSDFRLDWFEPDRSGGHWYVRLAERTQVPTLYLDACVLDPQGAGRIKVGTPAPATLTPGWLKRHEKLQEWAKGKIARLESITSKRELPAEALQLIEASLLESAGDLHPIKASIDVANKTVAFGVRRAARLSDPRTRALLTHATQHLGRAADEGPLLREPSQG